MVARAREQGHTIPEGLLAKFQHDGALSVIEMGLELGKKVDYDTRIVRADTELLGYLSSYPQLEQALPELHKAWRMVKFAKGKPVYTISLDTSIGSSEPEVRRMADLGLYIAKTHKGILYDSQGDTFGDPDVHKTVKSAREFFKDVAGLIKLSEGRVLDNLMNPPEE